MAQSINEVRKYSERWPVFFTFAYIYLKKTFTISIIFCIEKNENICSCCNCYYSSIYLFSFSKNNERITITM